MSSQRITYTWEEVAQLAENYITPQDPLVQAEAQDIINTLHSQGEDTTRNRMIEAYNRVAVNIIYRTDEEIHGQIEYWQTPAETIQKGTGNCEDSAFLLCSLHKALGVSSRIDFGTYSGQGHAWVEAYDDGWGGYMETTTDLPFSGFADPSNYVLEASTSWDGLPSPALTPGLQTFGVTMLAGLGCIGIGAFLMIDDAHDFGNLVSTYPPKVDVSWLLPASITGPHPAWPHHWIIGLILIILGIALIAIALIQLAITLLGMM